MWVDLRILWKKSWQTIDCTLHKMFIHEVVWLIQFENWRHDYGNLIRMYYTHKSQLDTFSSSFRSLVLVVILYQLYNRDCDFKVPIISGKKKGKQNKILQLLFLLKILIILFNCITHLSRIFFFFYSRKCWENIKKKYYSIKL